MKRCVALTLPILLALGLVSTLASCDRDGAALDHWPTEVTDQHDRVDVPTAHRPSLGPEDARVSLVVFSDFQCPFCSKLAIRLDELRRRYPDDVRVVFYQMPLPFHKEARVASRAALAAKAQGRFWEMHDLIFERQTQLGAADWSAWAAELGLNVPRFERDFEDSARDEQITADIAVAARLGVKGTPMTFVNGRLVRGARSLEHFDAIVEEELTRGSDG